MAALYFLQQETNRRPILSSRRETHPSPKSKSPPRPSLSKEPTATLSSTFDLEESESDEYSSLQSKLNNMSMLDPINERPPPPPPKQRTDTLFIYHPEGHDTPVTLDFTPHEITLVRDSWRVMIQDEDSHGNRSQTSINSITATLFCVQFYSNLISMDPQLERMFPSIKHQAISLSGVISTAIINLDHLEKLDDYILNLGKRHSRILGIEPIHFELMGVAMLKTFKDRFGAKFTLDLEKCWRRLFTYLSNQLLQMGIDPVLRLEVGYHTIKPKSSNPVPQAPTSQQSWYQNSQASSAFDTFSMHSKNSSLDLELDKPANQRQVSSPPTLQQQQRLSSISSAANSTSSKNQRQFYKMMGNKKKVGGVDPQFTDQASIRSNDEKCSIM